MANKTGKGWKRSIGLFGLSSLIFLGCFPNSVCDCTDNPNELTIKVVDELGPVDFARISVFRAADNFVIDSAMQRPTYADHALYMVFSKKYLRFFPTGDSTMEIRVIASKGAKSGEERIGLRLNSDRTWYQKISGHDSIFIR
jgi:hypothetical protein